MNTLDGQGSLHIGSTGGSGVLVSKGQSEAADQLPLFSQSFHNAKDSYSKLGARSRGARVHGGPLELRKSLPPRDCTKWIRTDKKYDPYSYFENPNNKPSPKPEKPPPPPSLWVPRRDKEPKSLHNRRPVDSSPPKEKTGPGIPSTKSSPLKEKTSPGSPSLKSSSSSPFFKKANKLAGKHTEKPPWDTEHHIMHSRMNSEIKPGYREYFDRPVPKDNVGVPKVFEQYGMHDRQCGWNDQPAPLGEYRRTFFNNIGPPSTGGCKQHQLPSYWRNIKDWKTSSAPELPNCSLSRVRSPTSKDHSLLEALADMPAAEATAFWRGWAGAKAEVPETKTQIGWDDRWNVTWSKDNNQYNKYTREYFSIPNGVPGRATETPQSRMPAPGLKSAPAAWGHLHVAAHDVGF